MDSLPLVRSPGRQTLRERGREVVFGWDCSVGSLGLPDVVVPAICVTLDRMLPLLFAAYIGVSCTLGKA